MLPYLKYFIANFLGHNSEHISEFDPNYKAYNALCSTYREDYQVEKR